MEIDLLGYIANKVSCEFVSDIRMCQDWSRTCAIFRCVLHIDASECTLREWNDAAQYITGEDIRFKNREAARNCILNFLRRKAHTGVGMYVSTSEKDNHDPGGNKR